MTFAAFAATQRFFTISILNTSDSSEVFFAVSLKLFNRQSLVRKRAFVTYKKVCVKTPFFHSYTLTLSHYLHYLHYLSTVTLKLTSC